MPTQASDKKNAAGVFDSEVQVFLDKFKQAIRTDDKDSIARMVSYSINVNASGKCKAIGGVTAFNRYFEKIFSPELQEHILKQKQDDLIITSRGVGFDRGAIWFAGICTNESCSSYDIKIITINGLTKCEK